MTIWAVCPHQTVALSVNHAARMGARNAIRIAPPLAIGQEEAELGLRIVEAALARLET